MAFTRLARVFTDLFRASSEYSSSIFEGVLWFLFIYRKCFALLNNDTLNALLITNEFYKKEKLLEIELAKQKLSSKPAKAAETVEAAVQKKFNQKLTRYSKIFPAKWQKQNTQTSYLSALGF